MVEKGRICQKAIFVKKPLFGHFCAHVWRMKHLIKKVSIWKFSTLQKVLCTCVEKEDFDKIIRVTLNLKIFNFTKSFVHMCGKWTLDKESLDLKIFNFTKSFVYMCRKGGLWQNNFSYSRFENFQLYKKFCAHVWKMNTW